MGLRIIKKSALICLIRVIRVLLAAPFLLALATVFVVSYDLPNGVISGKHFWFYGSMGLVSLTTFILAICSKRRFRFSILDFFVLLFVVSVYLSAWVFNDASQNTTKLTLLALLTVLYFSFRIIITPDRLKRAWSVRNILIGFLILTGLVEAVWGLLQLYGFAPSQHGLFRLTGSFFNPGPYAGYLAVIFPLALYHCTPKSPEGDFGECVLSSVSQTLKAPFRGLGVVTGIAILLVLPAAMSRASWLAVIAGSAIAGIGRWKGKIRVNPPHLCHPRSIIRYLVILVSVLLVCSACAGMYFLKKNSADGRLLTWKVSVQTIVKHPFGVGLGNFSGAYGEEQAAYFASGQASEQEELVAGNPEYGFNEYLQIGIESGIVSFLLFIGIIVLTFRSMLKNRDWAVMGSLTSLLVFAFFSYPFSVLPFGIVFVFLISIAQWNEWNADDEKGVIAGLTRNPLIDVNKCLTVLRGLRGKPAMTTLFKPAMTGIMFLLVCFCLYRQYPVYEACKTWNKIYYHSGMYKESAKEYEKLYPYLNDRIQFLFEYAQCLSKAGINDEQGIAGQARNDKVMKGAVTPDLIRGRNDRLLQSNEVLRRAMQISCDPMLYNLMGKNHQAMKEYDKAESAFIQSTRIVPSRLYPWYLLCKLHAERGMPEKANETAKIVLTKEPKVQSPAVREMREEVREIIKNYEL